MKNWENSIKNSLAHQEYRASRLAETKNPDYILKHANECRDFAKSGKSTECRTRLKLEQERRYKQYQPKSTLINQRFNRQK